MYNEVDVIGKKSVCELIQKSKLTKFIIFRGGSTKGSTPVFRCTDTSQIPKAIGAFTDWADSILRMNRNNNLPYDMFLYSSKTDEVEIDESVEEIADGKKSKTKTDKIRFTFSLNPYNNSGMGGTNGSEDIGTLIANALDARDRKKELEELREYKRASEAGELEEDGEEEEEENGFDKVFRLLKEVRLHGKPLANAAGDDDDDDDIHDPDADDDNDDALDDTGEDDDDDDDDDDSEEEEKAEKKKTSDKEVSKRGERLRKALKILSKGNPDIDKDLMRLARFKEAQPKLFSNYMANLRTMEF
jgi:hypothetical protein